MAATLMEPDPTNTQGFRNRLLDGLVSSIEHRGYRDTTVADIVRHAHTSKRTFYGRFETKEECFIELLRANNDALIARVTAAVDPDADWDEQIRQAVGAYVDHIAARPAITLSWIRELPALGAQATPMHRWAIDRLTDMLIGLTNSAGFRRADKAPLTRPVAVVLLGGLRELTALFFEDGRDARGILEPAVTASTALLGG